MHPFQSHCGFYMIPFTLRPPSFICISINLIAIVVPNLRPCPDIFTTSQTNDIMAILRLFHNRL